MAPTDFFSALLQIGGNLERETSQTDPMDERIDMTIPDAFKFLHPEFVRRTFVFVGTMPSMVLKESGHNFNTKFDEKIGFETSSLNPCFSLLRDSGS
jgi:hypothetical protein